MYNKWLHVLMIKVRVSFFRPHSSGVRNLFGCWNSLCITEKQVIMHCWTKLGKLVAFHNRIIFPIDLNMKFRAPGY
ncbi:hypothetical protein VNO80_28383 [Phaseolus coccineus]|uniref:Uncharacterized protein n=1 Tax=Phaseolus coccineus TaxID=3886 RepID=A0AAN9LA99_PHACN